MALLGTMSSIMTGCFGTARMHSFTFEDRARLYAAVLSEMRDEALARWVVLDTLLPARNIDADLLEKVTAESSISRRTLDAFLAAQQASTDRFNVRMLPDTLWSTVSTTRLEALRAASRAQVAAGIARTADGFWAQWWQAYPDAAGYVILAPVASRGESTAVVYVRTACGPLCGEDSLRLLQRDANGIWHTTSRVTLSQS